ncbi:MAG: hypothetical protein JSR36_06035 [Proteobacteria bacterium]|nr:hypothetical protein [Pseudomonadota bacterium]
MADQDYIPLIQAELDGQLDAGQRAELARGLLADPEVRAAREEFRRVQALLESVADVEPPADLHARVLQALPSAMGPVHRSRWPAQRWRYAALIAVAVGAGTLVYETVSPGTGSNETFGTMAAWRTSPAPDAVVLDSGPVTGRLSLYRDGKWLVLAYDLAAQGTVDMVIASEGDTVRKAGLDLGSDRRGTVALPEYWSGGRRTVDVTFVMAGREVGRTTLTASEDR